MYEKVKRFFDLELYTREQVRQFVKRGKLTAEQFREITGERYE